MKMKETLPAIAVFTMIMAFQTEASIGENFARAGIRLDGSGSLTMSDYTNNKLVSTTWGVGCGIFLVDGLLPYASLGYYFQADAAENTYWSPSLTLGLDWYFGYEAGAHTGLAHRVGFGVNNGIGFYNKNDPTYELKLIPSYTIMYFAAHRIAPGVTFSHPIIIPTSDRAEANLSFTVGFQFNYFIPTMDQVLIK